MNADAYLRKHGWKGSGHSLDSTGRGIKKPLLIAHKQDQLGLGKRKAAHTTDDQWWMRAFDQSLQSIGTGQESTLSQIRTKGVNRGGLYGFFVKGDPIVGTIDDSTTNVSTTSGKSAPTAYLSSSASYTDTSNMPKASTKRKRQDIASRGVVDRVHDPQAHIVMNIIVRDAIEDQDQLVVAAKLAKLSPEQTASYQARATVKNQSLSQYVLRRLQKKADQHALKLVESSEYAYFYSDLQGDTILPRMKSTKAGATDKPNKRLSKRKVEALERKDVEAVEDVEGEAEQTIDDAQNTSLLLVAPWTPLPDGTCPLDPKIWEGYSSSLLPKPVRKARRQWLAEQRLMRKFNAGGGSRLTHLTKAEKKVLNTKKKEIFESEDGMAKTGGEWHKYISSKATEQLRAHEKAKANRKAAKIQEKFDKQREREMITVRSATNGSNIVRNATYGSNSIGNATYRSNSVGNAARGTFARRPADLSYTPFRQTKSQN